MLDFDDLEVGVLEVRLRRVKRPMLDSRRVTRQRIRMNWTSIDGINNDEEKLLT